MESHRGAQIGTAPPAPSRQEAYASPVRLLLGMALVLLVLCVAGALAFLYLPAIGSFSPKALNYSVTKKAGGSVLTTTSPCRRARKRVYRCSVSDSGGSGGATYVVTLVGRCWKAHRDGGGFEGQLKRHAKGCVRWRDQLRLVDRI